MTRKAVLWDRRGGRRVREIEDYFDVQSPDGQWHRYCIVVVYGGTGELLYANVPVQSLVVTFSK